MTTKAKPVKAGPGRPSNPGPPRGDQQHRMFDDVELAETAREEAAKAYASSTTVAAELRLLSAELSVYTAWAAYCRAQGIHSSALKYGDIGAKTAARIFALRELLAADQLDEIQALAEEEADFARRTRA